MRALIISIVLMLGGLAAAQADDGPFFVGSKLFTESVILGEIARLSAPDGLIVEHRRELGGSRILFEALQRGDIDVYPEYTGTLMRELLKIDDPTALDAALANLGLAQTASLGFNNTYALALRSDAAATRNLSAISDLTAHPDLVFGFSNEFLNRADGWPGLRAHYGLPQQDVRGLDHELAYRGIAAGTIDVVDAYATDADLQYYDLTTLTDDRAFFPKYEAVLLYRRDLSDRAPHWVRSLNALAGSIDAPMMIRLNARAKLDGEPAGAVAANHLGLTTTAGPGLAQRLLRRTGEHLFLVGLSLAVAIVIAIPAGIVAAHRPRIGRILLSTASVLQTIPALALLVVLIPLLGIGAGPAITALIIYSILPILRNTHAGLSDIPGPLRDSARALALPARFRLWRIDLPLARSSILAGIKTAAVINVGTATLGALIGAGGYGQPILTGIRLDDTALILEGAIPAAALALAIQYGFERFDRAV